MRQEKWLRKHSGQIHAHVFLTCGAVFDYVSGRLHQAPPWMVRWHLEWLFRLIQEPRRLFKRYVFGIPYFFFRVFGELLHRCLSFIWRPPQTKPPEASSEKF